MTKAWQSLLPVVAALCTSVCAAGPVSAATLAFPIDVAAARAKLGQTDGGKFTCPKPLVPLVDMSDMPTFYKRTSSMSEIDPALMKAYGDRLHSALVLSGLLGTVSDRFVRSEPPRPDLAGCAMSHLLQWARAGAFLAKIDVQPEEVNHRQAIMVQAWNLAGLAIVYAKVRNGADLAPSDRQTVERWLHDIAASVQAEFSRTDSRPEWLSMNANHSHWGAAAVALVGALTGDRAMYQFGLHERDRALDVVGQNGALPGEMWRGSKAAHYQNFALLPISYLVALGDVNGDPLTPQREAALARTIDFTLDAANDPKTVSSIAGKTQENTKTMKDLVWIDVVLPHIRRTQAALAAKADAAAQPFRPLSSAPFTGGSVTGLFR